MYELYCVGKLLYGVVRANMPAFTDNALHYYANRNATNKDSNAELAQASFIFYVVSVFRCQPIVIQAYVAATASSVTVALAIAKNTASRASPFLGLLGPFLAVAAADIVNLPLMRQSELRKGIDVFDEDSKEYLGSSRRAGVLAVSSCVFGRVVAAAPILCLPPLAMHWAALTSPTLQRRPWLRGAGTLGLVGVCILTAVPLTFGCFRQTASVDAVEILLCILYFLANDILRKVIIGKIHYFMFKVYIYYNFRSG
jgi:hypothetical protein